VALLAATTGDPVLELCRQRGWTDAAPGQRSAGGTVTLVRRLAAQ